MFTARCTLIPYINQITFRLEKVNLLVHKRGGRGGICCVVSSTEDVPYISLNLLQFLLVFSLSKTKYFKFYYECWLHKWS